ncbi:MAG: polysaccharide deacetylase family protein [Jiangellaceae bacterium]
MADRLWPPGRGVVVLIYHRVGNRREIEVDLPASLFDEQMAWLASHGVTTTIDDALVAAAGQEPPGPDPVVVTFDDGTADMVEVALPILVARRVPAVFYLSTDFVERGRPFPHGGHPLSWSAVNDAVSTGLVTVGSHTHTHALLDRLDEQAAADELDRSTGLLADRVGVDAVHFAYPKAVVASREVEAVVRTRFRSAALAGTRPNRYGLTDPYRIARSPIQRRDGMVWFRRKLAGGLGFEDTLREAANRRRYIGRTT